MKKVLMIAYYFPPMGMGGVQRTAKFVRYLPEFGWEPVVLTVKPIHYYAHDESLLKEVESARIVRTESMDPLRLQYGVRRMLPQKKKDDAQKQRKPGLLDQLNFKLSPWLFIPDTKVPWVPFAVKKASALIENESFDLVFTTSPPHSSHLIGKALKRKFGIPWVADFRDNWLTESYERLPTVFHRAQNRKLAAACVAEANHLIAICQPIASYLQQLSGKSSEAFTVLPNGYDRVDFDKASVQKNSKMTLRYCGQLYPARSPEPFFKGLKLAVDREPALKQNLLVEFVGTINGLSMEDLICTYDLQDIVSTRGYVAHHESIDALLTADMLLLLISADSSPGIVTGKVFEYLASGKPVLGVVPQGEAAALLKEHQRGWLAHPENSEAIAMAILEAFALYQKGKLQLSVDRWESIAGLERREQTRQLADLLNQQLG